MNDSDDRQFRVTADLAKETLAAALRGWIAGNSWNQIRKLVEARQVLVNGNLCLDPARRLRDNDVIKILDRSAPPPARSADVLVEFCDMEVVVVDKPSGMTSVRHPEEMHWPARRKQLQPTLDELMPRVVARHESRGKPPTPPRIRAVHRLDRDTSGLMVFARSEEAERQLGFQFRKHSVHRRYLAVLRGRVEGQTIETRLVVNRGDGRRGSTPIAELGQHAVTHVRPVEYLDGYTLTECRLETGRTHQIRIHLSELGHPVAGDKVYNKPLHERPTPDESGALRLALHAAELGFEHPTTGESLRFHSPFPDDLKDLVARLRKKGG